MPVLRQRLGDVHLLVGVVAERDQVHAGLAEAAVIARQAAGAVGGILGVGDDYVDAALASELGQKLLHQAHPGAADDIADEE